MPKYTWKSRDISSVVEKFENIIYDIVKKHCFVEPPNSEQKKPKIECKDVVLERLKRQKKILRKQARRMKKKKSRRCANTERTVQSHTSPFRLRQTFQEKF